MKAVLQKRFLFGVCPAAHTPVDLSETEESLVFEVDMPGLNTNDIMVRVYNDLLIIDGRRRPPDFRTECGRIRFLCMERDEKAFRRVISIPVPVNGTAGTARYALGVLTVTLPKLQGKLIRIPVERI